MPSLLWFLIGLVLLAILVSVIWQVFGVGELYGRLTPNQRLLVALLGLLFIIIAIWWFLTNYMPGFPL